MVVLARSLDMPARLVNGFAGGRRNPLGGFVAVTRADAHAWVELHYQEAGWVRYDPTPPDLRLRGESGFALGERLFELASVIELWYFRRVVDFDRSDQVRALKRGWLAWRRFRAGRESGSGLPDKSRETTGLRQLSWTALGLGAAIAGWALLRVRRGTDRRDRRSQAYAVALRLLARRGLPRRASTTPRAFACEVASGLPPLAASSFALLTEAYLAERYGGRSHADSAARLRQFRAELRKRGGPARA